MIYEAGKALVWDKQARVWCEQTMQEMQVKCVQLSCQMCMRSQDAAKITRSDASFSARSGARVTELYPETRHKCGTYLYSLPWQRMAIYGDDRRHMCIKDTSSVDLHSLVHTAITSAFFL